MSLIPEILGKNRALAFTPYFPVVLQGASGVGRSALALHLHLNKFVPRWDPTIEDEYSVILEENNESQVWRVRDARSKSEFVGAKVFERDNAAGILLVYCVDCRHSFNHAANDLAAITESHPNKPVVIVGNKCDLEDKRVVTTRELEQLALRYQVPFVETSAKLSINIQEMAKLLSKELKNAGIRPQLGYTKENKCIIN